MEPTVATEAVGRMKAGRPGGCSKGDETNPARARSRDFLLHRAGKRRGGAGGREEGPGENGGWQVSVFWRRESSRRGAICLSTPSGPVVALGWARLAGHFGSGANLGSTAPGCENWAWPQLRPSTAPGPDGSAGRDFARDCPRTPHPRPEPSASPRPRFPSPAPALIARNRPQSIPRYTPKPPATPPHERLPGGKPAGTTPARFCLIVGWP